MPEYYLIVVVLLFILAISDLIVGVSNDAVNFLNSSIGSKVAPRKVIMVVASLGILVGATFSSGMMEVARKGIFQPEFFYFSEIMVVFIAVMITDILLLDLFNTFGMPTSTTVSIVFELLGAAVAVATLKILTSGESLSTLGDYINTSSAILIISGIFLSVLVAFLVGSIIQYLSRTLFSFHLSKRMKWVGGIWSGLALAALTHFLLVKGMKGASFISDDFISWVKSNTILLLAGSFIFWSVFMQILVSVFKVNVLRIVVLFGTFALAMAFAGNDLVNFIGVPIAGFESYMAWSASDVSASNFAMTALNEPVRTQTYMLVIAGAIMVVTLWFSKKARSVTETEVNLGRQDEGSERFNPNALSKGIVRAVLFLNEALSRIIPNNLQHRIAKNFEASTEKKAELEKDAPAFDLLRASVNLTVASVLIAFATSLKLPLSTTYVSFMVAMGTSLADRAWGRSSAVYRVAGVLNVIGGWFFTAIMAFTVSATFATLIFYFGGWAIAGLVALIIFLVSRTFLHHRKKEQKKNKLLAFEESTRHINADGVIDQTTSKVITTLKKVKAIAKNSIVGLIEEDRHALHDLKREVAELNKENQELNYHLFGLIKRIEETDSEASRLYLLVYDMEQDILQSTKLIADACAEYVENSMEPIRGRFGPQIRATMEVVDVYLSHLIELMSASRFEDIPKMYEEKQQVFKELEENMSLLIKGIKTNEYGMRDSSLYLSLLLESKDLVEIASGFVLLKGENESLHEEKK